jgi:hypothetical protein
MMLKVLKSIAKNKFQRRNPTYSYYYGGYDTIRVYVDLVRPGSPGDVTVVLIPSQ